MDMQEIKKLCKRHDQLVDNMKVIEGAVTNNNWLKISTPGGSCFYLEYSEVSMLFDYYKAEASAVEKKINSLGSTNNKGEEE